jgi:hypothetical protein
VPPRRLLPLRYLLSAILALALLPFAGWMVWSWAEANRLERALDALEARHEPLDPAEFNVKPATSDQREASHLYAQARKLVGNMPIVTDQAAALAKTIEQACASDADSAGQPARIHILRAFEERYAPVFNLIDRASRLDPVGWDDADRPERNSMDEIQSITLARANAVRIARMACTGESEAAAAALLSTLKLRHIWVPNALPPLTAHSLQLVLMPARVTAVLLEQIQREFVAVADDLAPEKWLQRARAYWLALMLPGVFSERPPGFDTVRITPFEAVAAKVLRPLRTNRIVAELAEFDQAMEVAKQPWPGRIDAVNALVKNNPANRSQSVRRGFIDAFARPYGEHYPSAALASYVGGIAEALARTRASVAAVAVARYRQDHAGNLPSSLEELAPGYLSVPPVDPFNGAVLVYHHDSGGFKIYSVGANRKDDGGTWEQHSDLQTMRRGNPLDIGIAVPPAPSRRAD